MGKERLWWLKVTDIGMSGDIEHYHAAGCYENSILFSYFIENKSIDNSNINALYGLLFLSTVPVDKAVDNYMSNSIRAINTALYLYCLLFNHIIRGEKRCWNQLVSGRICGNSKTSLIDGELVNNITIGGIPYSRARMSSVS